MTNGRTLKVLSRLHGIGTSYCSTTPTTLRGYHSFLIQPASCVTCLDVFTPSLSPPAILGRLKNIYRYLLPIGQDERFISSCKLTTKITNNKQYRIPSDR